MSGRSVCVTVCVYGRYIPHKGTVASCRLPPSWTLLARTVEKKKKLVDNIVFYFFLREIKKRVYVDPRAVKWIWC